METYSTTQLGSLRGKDPRKTSTVSMHQPTNFDATGRCPGVKSHHFGPGMKVVGGELKYAYEERPAVRAPVDDMNKLSKQYHSLPDTLRAPKLYSTHASLDTRRPMTTWGTGVDTNPTSTSGRPATTMNTTTTGTGKATANKKLVYWDGTKHIIAKNIGNSKEFQSPHLTSKDVEPGTFFGVRETPGSDPTKIVGSMHRRMPDEEGLPLQTGDVAGQPTMRSRNMGNTRTATGVYSSNGTFNCKNALQHSWVGPMTGKLGVAPYAPTHLLRSFGPGEDLDERSLRSYASTKNMGHKDYENNCQQLDFLDCWEKTESHLNSSVLLGRPSKLMTPYEHSTTRLSMRRTTVSDALCTPTKSNRHAVRGTDGACTSAVQPKKANEQEKESERDTLHLREGNTESAEHRKRAIVCLRGVDGLKQMGNCCGKPEAAEFTDVKAATQEGAVAGVANIKPAEGGMTAVGGSTAAGVTAGVSGDKGEVKAAEGATTQASRGIVGGAMAASVTAGVSGDKGEVGGAIAAGVTAGVSGDVNAAEGAPTQASGGIDTPKIVEATRDATSPVVGEIKAGLGMGAAPAPAAGGLDSAKIVEATRDATSPVVGEIKAGLGMGAADAPATASGGLDSAKITTATSDATSAVVAATTDAASTIMGEMKGALGMAADAPAAGEAGALGGAAPAAVGPGVSYAGAIKSAAAVDTTAPTIPAGGEGGMSVAGMSATAAAVGSAMAAGVTAAVKGDKDGATPPDARAVDIPPADAPAGIDTTKITAATTKATTSIMGEVKASLGMGADAGMPRVGADAGMPGVGADAGMPGVGADAPAAAGGIDTSKITAATTDAASSIMGEMKGALVADAPTGFDTSKITAATTEAASSIMGEMKGALGMAADITAATTNAASTIMGEVKGALAIGADADDNPVVGGAAPAAAAVPGVSYADATKSVVGEVKGAMDADSSTPDAAPTISPDDAANLEAIVAASMGGGATEEEAKHTAAIVAASLGASGVTPEEEEEAAQTAAIVAASLGGGGADLTTEEVEHDEEKMAAIVAASLGGNATALSLGGGAATLTAEEAEHDDENTATIVAASLGGYATALSNSLGGGAATLTAEEAEHDNENTAAIAAASFGGNATALSLGGGAATLTAEEAEHDDENTATIVAASLGGYATGLASVVVVVVAATDLTSLG
eukprot:gene23435-30720_t